MTANPSSSFRATLRQEIPVWLQEGIVTEEAAQRLAARYELNKLSQESSGLLAAVIFTIGGLLLGGGLLSFVAANWEEIPTFAKVAFLLSLLLAFHGVGYWLWHHKNWSRLGHALVFTGSLAFGANIGLMAQIFHVSGEWYGAFGAWALGSLVMAYAARSWITGLLALVNAVIWFLGISHALHSFWMSVVPLLIAALFLPLAWQLRSRVLYAATFVGFTISLCSIAEQQYSSAKYFLMTLVICGFLAWAAGEFHRVKKIRSEFGNPLAGLGIVTLGGIAYIWSFHEWWRTDGWLNRAVAQRPTFYWLLPTGIAVLIGLALIVTMLQEINALPTRRLLAIGITLASGILVVCALLGIMHRGDQILLTLVVNVAALIIAAVAIAIGVMDERRAAFWTGTVFVVVLILSRFLEYETSLLLKSAAFMICGFTMIAAGIAFEKHLRQKEAQL